MIAHQFSKKQEDENTEPDHQPFGFINIFLIQKIEKSTNKAAFYQQKDIIQRQVRLI
jgi:hypothetical protein